MENNKELFSNIADLEQFVTRLEVINFEDKALSSLGSVIKRINTYEEKLKDQQNKSSDNKRK